MKYSGRDPRALRLILSVLDRNEAAFDATVAELAAGCPGCLAKVVEDLAIIAADWIETGYDVEGRDPDRCLDKAIWHVKAHLLDLLDSGA